MLKLDLHGIKHEDVTSKVVNFIEKHWDSERELEIITGHSSKMKAIVTNILENYKLEYSTGKVFGINRAYIITWT